MSLAHTIFLDDPQAGWPALAYEVLSLSDAAARGEELKTGSVVAILANGMQFSASLISDREAAEGLAEDVGFAPVALFSIRAASTETRALDLFSLRVAVRCFLRPTTRNGGLFRNFDRRFLVMDGLQVRAVNIDGRMREAIMEELGGQRQLVVESWMEGAQ